MAGQQQYTGPYRIVARYDGAQAETVLRSGIADRTEAEAAARGVVGRHTRLVTVEDEPTSHTVTVVHDRDRPNVADSGEQSEGDTTREE